MEECLMGKRAVGVSDKEKKIKRRGGRRELSH